MRAILSDSQRLERLESASGELVRALQSAGIMALRLRQIGRRAPELAALVDQAHEELALLADACDDAHELIKAQLAADQAARSTGGAR